MTGEELRLGAIDILARGRRGEFVDTTDWCRATTELLYAHGHHQAARRFASWANQLANSSGRVIWPADQASASGGTLLSHPPEADDPINRARRTR